MTRVSCPVLLVVCVLLLIAGCARTSDPGAEVKNPSGADASRGRSSELASDIEGSKGEPTELERSLAVEIAGSLETTGAVLTFVGVPATKTAGVVIEVPLLASFDKRDVFRVINSFLKKDWSGEVTVNIEEHLPDGTVGLLVYSLFDDEGTAVMERYEGRATSPKERVRTLLPTGRIEEVTDMLIRDIAKGSLPIPEFENLQ